MKRTSTVLNVKKGSAATATVPTGDEMTIAAAVRAGIGYHPVYLRQKIASGEIPAVKVGNHWLLSTETVAKLRTERQRVRMAAGVEDVN